MGWSLFRPSRSVRQFSLSAAAESEGAAAPAKREAWLASAAGAGTALYLGVVTSALAFSLTTAGLARTPAATAATLALAEPLGAACWGIFLLHEDVSLTDGCGIGLLVLGVALLAFARPRTD